MVRMGNNGIDLVNAKGYYEKVQGHKKVTRERTLVTHTYLSCFIFFRDNSEVPVVWFPAKAKTMLARASRHPEAST